MTLKKSDKIIAIIGVIILIIAGIGIFLYIDTGDDNGTPEDDGDDFDFYELKSEIVPVLLLEKNQNIKQKLFGFRDQIVTIEQDLMATNVKNISVFVKFTDNNPGLLGRLGIGADTLTVNVLDSEGEKVGSGSKKGSGKIEIEIDGPASEIIGPIEARSYLEAEQMLMTQYEQFQQTYTFKIILDGKLFGFLREKLKGDSFKLEVTYCYYKYELEEPMNDDDNNPPTDSGFEQSIYYTMNYIGKH